MKKTDTKYYVMVEGSKDVYDIRIYNNKEAVKHQYQLMLASKEAAFGVYQEGSLTISYGNVMLLPLKHKDIKSGKAK